MSDADYHVAASSKDVLKEQVFDPINSINRLNIRQMQCFVCLADTLHFGHAAKRLNMSQSALSRQIKMMEATFGLELVERNSHNVKLTVVGEALVESCRIAFSELQTGLDRATRIQAGKEGTLQLGYNDFAINTELPDVITRYADSYPDIQIVSLQGPTEGMVELVNRHQIDIAFGTAPVRGMNIQTCEISQYRLIALLSNRHPLARKPKIYLDDLRNESFVLGTEEHWRPYLTILNHTFSVAGFWPRVSARVFNVEGILALVAANLGVTLYPDCILNCIRRNVVARNVEDLDAHVSITAFWQKSNRYKPFLAFLGMLQEAMPFADFPRRKGH